MTTNRECEAAQLRIEKRFKVLEKKVDSKLSKSMYYTIIGLIVACFSGVMTYAINKMDHQYDVIMQKIDNQKDTITSIDKAVSVSGVKLEYIRERIKGAKITEE